MNGREYVHIIEEIEKSHPLWNKDTIFQLAHTEGELEFYRLEKLYESDCVICGFEMGEHIWNKEQNKFIHK